jgi:hypothetical protein
MPFVSTEVVVSRYSDRLWRLEKEIVYKGKYQTWIVPVGFLTDFASVPAMVQWLIPSTGTYTQAAILHDYFCAVGIRNGEISARDTDGVFRRVMRELETPPLRRWLIWTGVRWGAAINPIRRPEWHKDFWPVLGMSILSFPIVAPASILAGIGIVIDSLVSKVWR